MLGPLLWNVMYDDFLDMDLLDGACMVGYADDAAVMVTAQTAESLSIVANDSLRRANRWLTSKGLKMPEHKTETTLITNRRVFEQLCLEIKGKQIPWSRDIRYLGVQLDDKLRFAIHLRITAEKATKTAAGAGQVDAKYQ